MKVAELEKVTFCCDVYHGYEKTGRIEIIDSKLVKNEVYTDKLLFHICPRSKTLMSVVSALKERIICEERFTEEVQKFLGLKEYNVYQILRKTHGVNVNDFLWLKFDDESITWDDVRVR